MILNSKMLTGKAKELETYLNSTVIGQEEAIKELCVCTQKYFSGLSNPRRPIAAYFFAGKTGCGKTKVAEELANFFGVKKFIKVNCGEYQHSHEIAKLVGSPPGYLGHNETKAVFNKKDVESHTPNVILFDEIEKATDAVYHLLLSILDKAEIRLGNNETVSFTNCIIVFTSNIGVDNIKSKKKEIAFVKNLVEKTDEQTLLIKAMNSKFRPEFINRLDEIIQFNSLTEEHLKTILDLQLTDLQNRILTNSITEKKIFFFLNDAAKSYLIDKGFSEEYGARFLNRVISKELEFPLACVLGDPSLDIADLVEIKLHEDESGLFFEKTRFTKGKKSKKVTIDL